MALDDCIPDTSDNFPFTEDDDDWLVIASGSPEYIQDCSLALSAQGIIHQVHPDNSLLFSREADSSQAIAEITACEQETRYWPPQPEPVPQQPHTGNPPTLLMFGALIIFYMVTGPWFADNPWFQAGAVDSEKIMVQHQWWRLLTALTLHADQSHLVGNCLVGSFIVHQLCKTTGSGTGWFSLLLAGMAANFLNCFLRASPHYSVGFSTALFAAIGIFSGLQTGKGSKTLLKNLLLPLGAGAALLAMLGTGGKHTDLGAHFFGFGCGIATGFLLRFCRIEHHTENQTMQHILFILSLLLIICCWLLATGVS